MPDSSFLRRALPMSIALILLNACGGGGGQGNGAVQASASPIPVADAAPVTAPPATTLVNAPSPAVAPATSSNVGAPILMGTPLPDVQAQEAYSFEPVSSDPAGKRLTFSVVNLPRWASFDVGSGRLAGTPTAADVGTYSKIVISVSNGTKSAKLPAFTITVNQFAVGSVSLSWIAPAQNTDGSVLTDLAGFSIRYGRTASNLSRVIVLKDPTIDSHVVTGLSSGRWYFTVSALNSKGISSSPSAVGSKVIG